VAALFADYRKISVSSQPLMWLVRRPTHLPTVRDRGYRVTGQRIRGTDKGPAHADSVRVARNLQRSGGRVGVAIFGEALETCGALYWPFEEPGIASMGADALSMSDVMITPSGHPNCIQP